MVPAGGDADAVLRGYFDQVVAWDERLKAAQARASQAAESAATRECCACGGWMRVGFAGWAFPLPTRSAGFDSPCQDAAVEEIDAAAGASVWRADASALAMKQHVAMLSRRRTLVATAMAAGERVLERVFLAAGIVADAMARSQR